MIQVVIADDSAFLRQVLTDLLEKSGKIKVIAAVKNGKEAVDAVARLKPELAIFDVEMPVMTGLEALRRVMEENPLPVLMFSSLTSEGASVTIKALEYGAADFLLKPTSLSGKLSDVAQDIVGKVSTLAMRSRFSRLRGSTLKTVASAKIVINDIPAVSGIEIVAMGSSTGGVQASLEVLKDLPPTMPPIVWVQHMPATFTAKLAERFDSICKIHVKEAKDGDVVEAGICYLGPGGVQMRVRKNGTRMTVSLGEQDKVNGFSPSCDVLFDSVSLLGKKSVGVILTGMGNDGTKGLVNMKGCGAYVLGQDEASSVVYGMPRAAFEAGAVNYQAGIEQMGTALLRACSMSR